MKYLLTMISFVLLSFPFKSIAQPNVITGVYNPKKNQLKLDDQSLKNGKDYSLQIMGSKGVTLNSSSFNLIIETDQKNITLNTPEILSGFIALSENPPQTCIYNGSKEFSSIESIANGIVDYILPLKRLKSNAKKELNKFLMTLDSTNQDRCSTDKEFQKIILENILKQELKQKYELENLLSRLNDGQQLSISEIDRIVQLQNSQSKQLSDDFRFVTSIPTSNDTIISKVFKAGGDFINLNLKILDRNNEQKFEENIELSIRNKWRFNFSTGIFLNSITNKNYFLSPSPTDTIVNIVNIEIPEKYDVSFGATATYNYRISTLFGLGPYLGAALSPFDGKVRYHGGLYIGLGKKESVNISFGYAIAKFSSLSDEVNEVGEQFTLSKLKTTIPVVDKWANSFVIGISYSLFKTD